jgi:hypothetical protein
MAEALAYFDTSAMIKRYVEEPGFAHTRRLMRHYRVLSSVIAPVEAVSAVARPISRRRSDPGPIRRNRCARFGTGLSHSHREIKKAPIRIRSGRYPAVCIQNGSCRAPYV